MTGGETRGDSSELNNSHLLGATDLPLVPTDQLTLDDTAVKLLEDLPESFRQSVLQRLARSTALNPSEHVYLTADDVKQASPITWLNLALEYPSSSADLRIEIESALLGLRSAWLVRLAPALAVLVSIGLTVVAIVQPSGRLPLAVTAAVLAAYAIATVVARLAPYAIAAVAVSRLPAKFHLPKRKQVFANSWFRVAPPVGPPSRQADFVLLYRTLESRLRQLARSEGTAATSELGDIEVAPILDIVSFLVDHQVLDEGGALAFSQVLDIRNRIVHQDPSRLKPSELNRGVELARLLARRVQL